MDQWRHLFHRLLRVLPKQSWVKSTGMKKNIHPFCHQKNKNILQIFKIPFQNDSKPGRIKKNKASTNFPHLLLHLSLVWTTILQLFGHDRLQFLLQRLQILGRRPGGTPIILPSVFIQYKNLENITKNIPFVHLINPNQPPRCQEIDVTLFWGGRGHSEMVPKKKPSLDISPGMGITLFEVGSGRFSLSNCRDIPWSLFCCSFIFKHPTNFFT